MTESWASQVVRNFGSMYNDIINTFSDRKFWNKS